MVDFVLDYENILFLRRGNDCFYVRYKGDNKTEFCIPFSSLLEWDKNIEFYDHCKRLEEAQGLELYPEKTNYYKLSNFISVHWFTSIHELYYAIKRLHTI